MGAEHLAGVIVLLLAAELKQDADEFVADRNHRLFLLQRVFPARREIHVQGAKLRIFGDHRQGRPEQQGSEATDARLKSGHRESRMRQ